MKCKGCGKEIVWIETASGRQMPCDAVPVYFREDTPGRTIVLKNGVCVRGRIDNTSSYIGFIPHWETCVRSGMFRRTETGPRARGRGDNPSAPPAARSGDRALREESRGDEEAEQLTLF